MTGAKIKKDATMRLNMSSGSNFQLLFFFTSTTLEIEIWSISTIVSGHQILGKQVLKVSLIYARTQGTIGDHVDVRMFWRKFSELMQSFI